MLTDQQLMLLEHLTYIHDNGGDIYNNAGTSDPGVNTASVAELLAPFTEERLAELEQNMTDDFTTGAEWAAIIREIQQDPNLMELELKRSTTVEEGIYTYVSPSEPDRAYVFFAGTRDGDEWIDNFEGLNTADTDDQKRALEVIEGLPYDHITVVGHSKGGNKAMYVTVLSDKVDHCVSMDGQGFSQEFLDKYWAEIQLKGDKITNYSLTNDYVNILMYPIPGSSQIYIDGGINGAYNHSPSKLLPFVIIDGQICIVKDDNGNIAIRLGEQSKGMKYLHEFTCFIISNATPKDKERLIEVLGMLLALARDESFYREINGKRYDHTNIKDFIIDYFDDVALAIAYLAKYIEIYGLSEYEIEDLLRQFGFGDFIDELKKKIESDPALSALAAAAGGVLTFLFGQMTDGKRDKILEKLLSLFDGWFKEKFGIGLSAIWHSVDSAYNNLDPSVGKNPIGNGNVRAGRIYNRRKVTYDTACDVVRSLNAASRASVSAWSAYKTEDWFGKLLVSVAVKGLEMYSQYVQDSNEKCLEQINRIFQESWALDAKTADTIRQADTAVRKITSNINQIRNTLG